MLSYEEMCLEYMKGYQDKSRIYFIENYLSTFNADVRRTTPFKLFPRQKQFLRTVAEKPNTIAVKHRQCGITTISSAWVTGQFVFCDPDSKETVLAVANKLDLSVQIIDKIRDFLMQVPRWMWGDEFYSPDPKSEKNKKDIFIKNSKQELELFNGCRAVARSSGENASRGISAVSILIMDEAAFISEGMSVYSSAVAAMASVKDAKIIMVSTPCGKDPLYYNTYRKAINGENNFTPVEFRWYQDLRYNRFLKWYKKNKNGDVEWDEDPTIDKNGNIIYDEERWKRLTRNGWTPTSPWYEEMCKSFNNDEMKIAQELDVSFLGSSNNVVQPEVIDMHAAINVREPLEDFKDPIVPETWFWKKPIPNHRYILACLPKGEEIRTKEGVKNIEDITKDDVLIDKDGNYTNIVECKSRYVTNEDIYEIKIANYHSPIKFTGNHPIYASQKNEEKRCYLRHDPIYKFNERYLSHDFKFIKASELKEGDWVQLPNQYYNNFITDEELRELGKKYDLEEAVFNENFWWYCGMWLAEGCACFNKKYQDKCTIFTSHHINETEYKDKCCNVITEILNCKPYISDYEKVHCTNIAFFNYNLGKFLHENFGRYADGKYINETIKKLPYNFRKQLIKGYFEGDGSIYEHKRDGTLSSCASVSKHLIEDIQDLLFSFGIVPCVTKGKVGETEIQNRRYKTKILYELKMQNADTIKFLNIFYDAGLEEKTRRKGYIYVTKDMKYINFKITHITKTKYTGIVYNFETESHTYCCNRFSVHNCDSSSGSAEDRTAIEVIDVDGEDENGLPIVEQVMEYNGKQYGDTIGEMIYQYAKLYNDAFVVIESIGGYGDSALLTLIRLGYKNLYYEDKELSKYTSRISQTKFLGNDDDKLPGFRNNSVRFQMLSHFAIMLRNNEFKVRSKRVIMELETWIFKGETGRMDHMDGAHDDTITCLAMGLFVMKYYFNRLVATKAKDEAILNAYFVNSSSQPSSNGDGSYFARPKDGVNYAPLYTTRQLKKPDFGGNYLWMLSTLN